MWNYVQDERDQQKRVWSPCTVLLSFSAVQCYNSLHCESAAACWTLSQLDCVWVYNVPKAGGGVKKQWRGWTPEVIGWSRSVTSKKCRGMGIKRRAGKRKGGWELTIQKPCLTTFAFSGILAAILPNGNRITNISQRNRSYEHVIALKIQYCVKSCKFKSIFIFVCDQTEGIPCQRTDELCTLTLWMIKPSTHTHTLLCVPTHPHPPTQQQTKAGCQMLGKTVSYGHPCGVPTQSGYWGGFWSPERRKSIQRHKSQLKNWCERKRWGREVVMLNSLYSMFPSKITTRLAVPSVAIWLEEPKKPKEKWKCWVKTRF